MIRLLPFLALVACTPLTPPDAAPAATQIHYQAGACFGRCPMYTVTVDDAGRGLFIGERFTAGSGERRFTATPAQLSAFREALAKALAADPKDFESGGRRCRMQATDHPSVTLTVTESGAPAHSVRFDYGCRDEVNEELFADLRRAPETLPIGAFIGSR